MRARTLRIPRISAFIAAGALALSGITSGTILAIAPAADAVSDPLPANQAAGWLKDQLTNGIVHNDQYDFDDIGLSADFAYALAAVGGQDASVNGIVDAIEPRAHDEWYTSTYNGVTTTYGGSIAKLMALVQQTGGNPRSFGGHDLLTLVENHTETTPARRVGRLVNENDSFGDANVIGQAYAAHALDTAGSAKAAGVTAFLLKQQCSSGYFRLNFSPKSATNQSCVKTVDEPDTDVTAIAIRQLASQSGDPSVAAAVASAKRWLRTQQRCDGSFGGGTSTEGSNANSTGLVAWALGSSAAARQAGVWLRNGQVTGADSGNALAGEVGAISYDRATLAEGRSDGITSSSQDRWRRATAQATLGIRLYSSDPTPALDLSGPTGYVAAGGSSTFTTTGAAAGTVLCLTGANASTRNIATADPSSVTVTLPAGTADRTYRVRDPYGHVASTMVHVLGQKTLTIRKSRYRVRRGHTVYATIAGLAAGEAARIDYRGSVIRRGTATSAGEFTARFRVGRSLGRKRIVGYGQFPRLRRGQAVIRVVR